MIAECLARPGLTERLITELYAVRSQISRRVEAARRSELGTHGSVSQMKQTSGMYTEIEWIKSDAVDTDSAPADAKGAQALKMNGSEWQESVAKLAAQLGSTKPGRARPELAWAGAPRQRSG